MKAQFPRLGAARGLLAALLLVVPTAPAAAQTAVYELPVDESVLAVLGILFGEEEVDYAELVGLGGGEHLLTDLMIPMYSDLVRDASVTSSLWLKDPGTGAPAAPFWSSTQAVHFDGNLVNAGLVEVGFSGIDLVVPDEFFWSVRFNDVSSFDPQDEELSYFGPTLNSADNLGPAGATTDPEVFWQHRVGESFWTTSTLESGADATLSATLSALPVPEPAVPGMALLGLAAWLRRRRSFSA